MHDPESKLDSLKLEKNLKRKNIQQIEKDHFVNNISQYPLVTFDSVQWKLLTSSSTL